LRCLLGVLCALLWAHPAGAAGGPLGIDHRLHYDNAGIWRRKNQLIFLDVLIAADLAGGVWGGGATRLGRTTWQSIDALVLGGVSSTLLKWTFTRERPVQTDDPNQFFTGHGHQSFPSGEVTATASIVTPFVLEYGAEHPWVWGLEVLPAYDAEARMKVWGHWQSDVLFGFVLGSAVGYYAHTRGASFSLSVMPHAVQVGLRTRW
jgi:membrane-associated phospholipid phosphatase